MSDGSMILSPAIVKPVASGFFAGLIDRMVLKNENFNSNLMFGTSVGVGTFVGDYLGETLSSAVPDGSMYIFNGKTLLQRTIEISTGTAGAWAMNRYVLDNSQDYYTSDFAKRVGVIALSQILGEYTADYLSGKPLGYLA